MVGYRLFGDSITSHFMYNVWVSICGRPRQIDRKEDGYI